MTRHTKMRTTLLKAIESVEKHIANDKRPAESALAYLSGWLESDAPEFAAGLLRIVKLHHEREHERNRAVWSAHRDAQS